MEVNEIYGEGSDLTHERRRILAETTSLIKKAYREQREWDAYMYFTSITDLYEILWVNLQLDSKERASIKIFQQAERKVNE